LLSTCYAIAIAITTVLPEPAAIFAQRRSKGSPSPGISMPWRSAGGPSMSQISVSIASSWQKKKRAERSASRQWSSRRFVVPVTPG
jgi:hypothetical protein